MHAAIGSQSVMRSARPNSTASSAVNHVSSSMRDSISDTSRPVLDAYWPEMVERTLSSMSALLRMSSAVPNENVDGLWIMTSADGLMTTSSAVSAK